MQLQFFIMQRAELPTGEAQVESEVSKTEPYLGGSKGALKMSNEMFLERSRRDVLLKLAMA